MRSVLVTGCSSGFGLETAVLLGSHGWHVFASMRDLERRGDLDEARKAAGIPEDHFELLQLDVTDPDSVTKAAGYVVEATGGSLDAVVQNAGIAVGGFFEELPDARVREVIETNFFGVLAVTREVLPAMRAQRQGRIVLVSSDSAFGGTPALSAYVASKWALEGWAESVAMELQPFGVHLVVVEPGAYRTSIWDKSDRIRAGESAYAAYQDAVEAKADAIVERHARDPREVAEVIRRALDARRPRFRYPVGPDSRALGAARGVIPYGIRSAVLRRYLGAPRS